MKEVKILGLVSNFDHPPHVRKYLSHYGLDNFFSTVIISGDVGLKKPNPDIFLPALSATGLSPKEVAYVGDTYEDIEAANAAGIMPILINRQDEATDRNCLDFEKDSQNKIQRDVSKNLKRYATISNLRELICV